MDIELVTDPCACMMYIVSPLAGLAGGILWRPPAYSLLFYSDGKFEMKMNVSKHQELVCLTTRACRRMRLRTDCILDSGSAV